MDQLQGMRVFCQIVESGSMAAAARALGLAPASVTGSLARLEQHLGLRLLQRSTRALSLTEAGEVWYRHAKQILEDTAAAQDAVRRMAHEPQGRLHLTASPEVARHFVTPWLGAFAARYPGITLTLHIDDRVRDLFGGELDLALRTGRLHDSSLVALPLWRYPHLICASPGYLARHGLPTHPEALQQHQLLTYRHQVQWSFQHQGQALDISLHGQHVSNQTQVLMSLALADQGIVRQPDWVVADALQAGQLVEILPQWRLPPARQHALHAVLPERHYRPAKVEAFIASMRHYLANRPDALTGGKTNNDK